MDLNSAKTDQIIKVALVRLWPVATWRSLTARALYQAAQLDRLAQRAGGSLRLVRASADVQRLVDERRTDRQVVAGWLGIEGAQALDGEVETLDRLYSAGFRIVGLAHLADNEFAGSAHGMTKHGLTPLGRQLVQAIEAKRMIVDLSHASPATIDDVMRTCRRSPPMAASSASGSGRWRPAAPTQRRSPARSVTPRT